jgi:hypothetical protein
MKTPTREGLHPSTPFMAVRRCPKKVFGQPHKTRTFEITPVVLRKKRGLS